MASLRRLLDSKILHNNLRIQTYWSKLLPGKVNLHGWKARHKRLATYGNLLKRGIISAPKPCPFCTLILESEDHVFVDCFFARYVLLEIASWWKIPPPANTIESLFSWGELNNFSGEKLMAFKAVVLTYLWQMWKSRNELVHDKKKDSIPRMFSLIQSFSFFWIKSRKKLKRNIDWYNWCCMPFSFPSL